MSQAQMKIPVKNLQTLPEGSGYNQKSGQAQATVRKQGDTLYITAVCDSLMQLVYSYEQEITNLRTELEEVQTVTPCTPTGWQWFWIRFGQLSAIVLVGYFLTKKLKNLLTQKLK